MQGQLGDCWFLAAAAALAEHPDRIRDIFYNTEYSQEGAFEVILYHKGLEVTMVVDDRLPIYEGKDPKYTDYGIKTTVNAGPSRFGAWWVPILEKAYAKFNQNYAQLSGGSPEQSLRELTGMPVETYHTHDQSDDELFATISNADVKDFTMTANCMNDHSNLTRGHAYTMLGAIKLSTGQYLIKMRNPWGTEKYSGPWNDDDERWTPTLLQEAGHIRADDGIFYMPI